MIKETHYFLAYKIDNDNTKFVESEYFWKRENFIRKLRLENKNVVMVKKTITLYYEEKKNEHGHENKQQGIVDNKNV